MKRGGFSLLEVLIAASIVSIVVIMIAQLQGTSLFSSRQARLMHEATDVASHFVEDLRAQPANIPALCGNQESAGFALNCASSSLGSNPPSYMVHLEVSRNSKSYLTIHTVLAVKP